jgi:hypothetical protein
MALDVDRGRPLGSCEARLTTEDQVNALVKQGNALPTVGNLALPVPVLGGAK